MGRNRYLGGSTVLNEGSGWFSRQTRLDPYAESLLKLRNEQLAYLRELANQELADRIVAGVHAKTDPPFVDLVTIVDIAQFVKEVYAVPIRGRERSDPAAFDAGSIRANVCRVSSRHLSLWALEDRERRRALAVHLIKPKQLKLVGFYPDENAFVAEATASGWLVTDRSDISAASDAQIETVWMASWRAKPHPFWHGRS